MMRWMPEIGTVLLSAMGIDTGAEAAGAEAAGADDAG
eukprot:CAMPEP_0114403848 /NCGR_PEP_ID=MMETSP0102-20121206/19148_1 /TAXON_ID=38822 ORGANISM="Pteridomonas danica, Strain PT" /NCGR_SAMPLE_ID=MMETSP0102 /ASSEMBLY_ACC=CAM_ASM_000212 /LENGTH=36 /DNA_ID= /DNA_START= /DNA_END= /DNA_ORIENTATION=